MAECKDCFHFKVCAYADHYLPVCDSFVTTFVADVAPVVRCGECKYQRFTDDNVPYCTRVDDDGLDMPFDDCFCSYGEKREETA